MNGGILHTGRGATVPPTSKSKLPKEALAMARQLGLTSEDLKEMEGMWKNMDDLAEKDPASYSAFIHEHIKDGPPKPEETRRSFLPIPSFVIKSKVTTGQKCFVNMCSHQAVERPSTPQGGVVEDGDYRSAQGLQVPMLVSKVRVCKDHGGVESYAVDVVFHPWVVWRCDPHDGKEVGGDDGSMFKAQIIELALTWVTEETKSRPHEATLVFDSKKRWKTIKSKYKGGDGPLQDLPVPFPVDSASEQEKPVDEREFSHEMEEVKVESPQDILRTIRSQERENLAHDLNITPSMASPTTNKPLVQPVSSTTPPPAPGTKAKPQKPAVKAGFLNSSKARLYDEDGSQNGGLEGSYSKFMSKCKVVDMSTMSPEEQQKAMKNHASSNSTSPPPTIAAPSEQPPRKDEFSGMGTGFLEGASLGSGKRAPNDRIFDSLVAEIDPDYAQAAQPPEDLTTKEAFESLSEIAKVLGQGLGEKREEPKHTIAHTPLVVAAGHNSKRVASTAFSFTGVPDVSLSDISLEVGLESEGSLLRFSYHNSPETLVSIPFKADPNLVKAKFKKKDLSLHVKLYEQ